MKPNGDKYYKYVLCYVDDILAISHDPKKFMEHLSENYTLKKDFVCEPTQYLGADVRKFDFRDGIGLQTSRLRL